MIGWLRRSLFGGDLRRAQAELTRARADLTQAASKLLHARYDSATTTDENQRTWAWTDLLSAKAANNFMVRQTLRRRSRYTIENNGYARGIVNNKANDLISTGPTLQVKTPDHAANKQIVAAWSDWWQAVNGVEKIRIMAKAKIADGEGFLVLKTNPRCKNPVQLCPVDIEADQVTTPDPKFAADFWVDGLILDDCGDPVAYNVLKNHPGDLFLPQLNPLVYDRIPARHVIHWFRKDRPGQARGIPELTPSLDLFEEMRAFRKSTLSAARIAAVFSAVLESQMPSAQDTEPPPYDSIPMDNGMMTTLPWGYKLSQLAPSQPTTNFETFVDKLLAEACRPINIPVNVALGSSQKFNFSSAQLDHINYRADLVIERFQCEHVAMERIYEAWYDEAIMIPGLLPKGISYEQCIHEWHWPGFMPLDNLGDAQADIVRLNDGTMTWAEYWSQRGYDWRERFAQRGIEAEEAARLGLVVSDDSGKPLTETDPERGDRQ